MNVVLTIRDPMSDAFIKILRSFLTTNLSSQINIDSTSFFTFPILQESKINEVKNMLDDGVSISGCCRFLSNIFNFDPALVNAIKNHQIPPEESKIGKISSVIAWIGSEKYCTSDFFFLLVCTLLADNFDITSQFCLKLMINHYCHNTPKLLSTEAVDSITQFFKTNNIDINYKLDVLNDLLNISIKIKDSNISSCILRAILIIVQKNSALIANYDFKDILNTSSKLFQKLNMDALSLLGGIANISSSSDEYVEIFQNLAKNVISTFSEQGTQISVKNITPTTDFFLRFIIDYQINFDSFKFFPQVTDVLPSSSFDTSLTVSNILNRQQFEVLKTFQAIFHLFHHHLQHLTLSFFSSLVDQLSSENNTKSQCIETLIFYLYLIENIPKISVPKSFCEVIIHSDIFSPKFTIFYSDKDDFQILNNLRNLALNFLYSSDPEMINLLNSNLSDYPFMIVENYSRLRTFLSVSEMSQFLNSMSIYDLTLVLKNLVKKMSEPELNEIDRKHVFTAWSTLFVCINDFLNDSHSIVKLFQSLDFTSNYIRHFFNPSLRPLIFSTLQRYMTMSGMSLSMIAQFCLYIFSYAIYNHDDMFHQLMTDLLACLEDAIVHNPEIVKELSVITPAILSFFLHFPTKELLKNTLNFLLLVSFNTNNFSFSHDEMLSLGNTIRTMDSDGLSEKNFSIILSLLAGTKISNMSQNFTIKNPSFILLVLYVSADDISQSIQFFYRLCQYSIFNCVQCHKGNLDLFLIELIRNYPNPFKFFDSTFNSSFTHQDLLNVVIQFLSLIFTYQCSPQSVERFIGLAVPKPSAEIQSIENNLNGLQQDDSIESIKKAKIDKSDIFTKFIKCDVTFPPFSDEVLNQVISTGTNMHDIQYVFTPSATPIIFDSIPLSDLSNGYSFSCYLMVDLAISQNFSQKQIIFKLSDSSGSTLLLYSSRTALLCEMNDVTIYKSSSVSLTTELPSCQWSMVTITIKKIPDSDSKVNLIFSLNKDSKPPFTITDVNFNGQYLTAQIGGFTEQNPTINKISCFLSSFHLFNKPLNPDFVSSLFSFGPKGVKVKDLLENATTSSNCKSNNIYSYIKPFSYIFREYNLIKLMIPFFGFSNYAPHFFLEKIVDSFRHVPLEQYDQYISIFSQFLMNAPANVICYSLYLHFFMLFTETQSSLLFKHILFNFNIWFNADDPQAVKRTVQHWANVLFPDFSQIFIENTSIPEILTLIRIHCWFTDEESNNMINHKRCHTIDVNVVRNCLNRLIAEFASYKLTMDDVRSILSNTFTTHDIQHKLSFLSLLDNISSLILDKSEVASELHILFTTSRPDLFMTTLNLILKLSDEFGDKYSPSNSDSIVSDQSHPSSFNMKLMSFSSHKPVSTSILKNPNVRGRSSSTVILSPNKASIFNTQSGISSSSSSFNNINNYIWTDNHIECVLFHINKQHLTVPILDAVLATSQNYPEALPIACMIACNLGEEEQLKTIEAFTSILCSADMKSNDDDFFIIIMAQKRVLKLKTWFIWPIILTMKVKSSKEHHLMMLQTITSVAKNNYTVIDQILAFLDLIYIHYGTKVTTFQLEILDIVFSKITDNSKVDSRKLMYRFVRNLLFHYDRNIHSTKLMNEFENSPFCESSKKSKKNQERNLPFDVNSMKDVQNLFSEQSISNELIFRVELDDENVELFKQIINKLDKFEFNNNSEEDDNLNCYMKFIKYLNNKDSMSDSDRAKTLQTFAHEGWRNFQAMNISFKMYMNSYCNDIEKFLTKIESIAKDLLSNLNEESIKLSLISIDILNDRKINQYCQSANLFNRFESLEMNEFSIWNSFNEENCLTKKEERKSFHLLSNFSCPFTKKVFKLYYFEIDPFFENSKPILKMNALYVKFLNTERCTFAILPKKIIIATKFKKIYITVSDITHILYRNVNCFEFVKKTGKSYIVNFLNTTIEDIIKSLKQVVNSNFQGSHKPIFQTSSFSKFIHIQNFTNDWVNRKMTTFEYLLKLNFFGGRSYKMLSNYPIFPFIRDFTDTKSEYKISPQSWLRMFHPYKKCFNPDQTKTIDLSLKRRSSDFSLSSADLLSTSNSNEIAISSDDEKVHFGENSSNSDGQIQTQNQSQDEDELGIAKNHRPSDILTSSLISTMQNLNLSDDQPSKYSPENGQIQLNSSSHSSYLFNFNSSKMELTPEFFMMPECFESLELPSGVSSQYEFVYENRKKLESDEVSNSLNLWIDRLFGPNGSVEVLFKSPHPVRNGKPLRQPQSKSSNQDYQLFLTISSENLIFGKIQLNSSNSNDKILVKTVTVSGYCCEHQVDVTKKVSETQTLMQVIYSPKTAFSAIGDVILAVDTETGVFSVISGTQIVKTQLNSPVDFCEEEAVFGSNGGFIFAVQPDNKTYNLYFLGKAKISPELIVTITSSRKYDRTAVSVFSGKIIIFERITGRYLRVIDTEGIPAKRLLILEGFGFIVAEFPSELALFSLSGDKIRSMKVNYEIFFLSSFVSEDGFDYLFMSDKRGQTMIIEAFTFKVVEKSGHNINTTIIDINYIPSLGSLLILTQDGKLFSFS
ncbi:hypothetical protein M9Y10_020471 [Tritrichomonas musculus]|uniref:BEACH domain-containing protein n=1 Tax=Tritrichomonas musculus TaxID=1915356 RepID=A0ABR2HIA0_9EUKA